MSYTVLARKFRSKSFDEVVGQGPITTTLKNAITANRVHHGYLFTGTRGVGKTSMARILAKALNCLAGDNPTVTPCGECDSCKSIATGEDIDVVEIDAASNTGVDNIRELRNNAVFRPARSRFKIYIIDEVHMLSTGAFNALLKTLEEPPPHVKFILATTEVQKVPATILSRVQRFDFKSISPAEIASQLRMICGEEAIEAEDAALKRLARLANGSMRDALSLLDQVISMSGQNITAEAVNELLPASHDEQFAALIDRLAESDAAGALLILDRSLSGGQSLDVWCSRLIGQLRDLMIIRICGPETDLADIPAGLRSRIAEQSQKFDSGAYVYMISVLEELRRNVRSSGIGRALVETAIIRLSDAVNFSSIESLLERVDGTPVTNPPSKSPAAVAPTAASKPITAQPRSEPAASQVAPVASAAAPVSNPSRRRAPAPSTEPPALPGMRSTQADLRAAQNEPIVKAALELFGGQIVHVQRDSGGADA